jgi:hypothetical protein
LSDGRRWPIASERTSLKANRRAVCAGGRGMSREGGARRRCAPTASKERRGDRGSAESLCLRSGHDEFNNRPRGVVLMTKEESARSHLRELTVTATGRGLTH